MPRKKVTYNMARPAVDSSSTTPAKKSFIPKRAKRCHECGDCHEKKLGMALRLRRETDSQSFTKKAHKVGLQNEKQKNWNDLNTHTHTVFGFFLPSILLQALLGQIFY